MSRISFEASFRKKGEIGTHISRHAAAAERAGKNGERGVALGGRAWEHGKARNVGLVLEKFEVVSKQNRFDLMNEAETMSDVLNLSPGLLAGAQAFYATTRGAFSPELFRKHAPGIVATLMQYNSLVPVHQQPLPGATVERYLPSLLRYIARVGALRGIEGFEELDVDQEEAEE